MSRLETAGRESNVPEVNRIAQTSRREFLGKTVAALGAVAFPHIIPSSVLGDAGKIPPNGRIVMGGIGLGGQGQRNMRNFLTHSDVQWVAVCDADTGRRNGAKAIADENYGNKDCAAYADDRCVLKSKARNTRSETNPIRRRTSRPCKTRPMFRCNSRTARDRNTWTTPYPSGRRT